MRLVLVVASLSIAAGLSARADELCVACEQPAATYRCAVEQPSDKFRLGADIEQEVCAKVLSKKGEHQSCRIAAVPAGGSCEGARRSVTLADYQAAVSPTGESTYEVGALEIARRNVHDTWLCVTSMFKDC